MVVDVSGNIGDLIVIEAASESRHGVLSVGHLREVDKVDSKMRMHVKPCGSITNMLRGVVCHV